MAEDAPTDDNEDGPPTDQELNWLQLTTVLCYLRESNPDNGLVRDKTDPAAPCVIAAVGLALAICCRGTACNPLGPVWRRAAAARATDRSYGTGARNGLSSKCQSTGSRGRRRHHSLLGPDRKTCPECGIRRGHSERIVALAASPDAKTWRPAVNDQAIRLWNFPLAATGAQAKETL
jgi:hypothetical protein